MNSRHSVGLPPPERLLVVVIPLAHGSSNLCGISHSFSLLHLNLSRVRLPVVGDRENGICSFNRSLQS